MLIFIILIFLLLSAFFSGSEIAYVSASKLGIELKKNQGSRRGKVLSSFYENPKSFLGTMLIGNNIALVIFTYACTKLISPWLISFLGDGFLLLFVNTILITIVVLIFGEFLPKNLFRLYANKLLYFFTYPLAFFRFLFAIPTWFTTKVSSAILKYVLKVPMEESTYNFTRLDLEDYVEDTIDEDDNTVNKELFNNALKLNQVKVRDCMIPRNEIVHIDKNESIEELKDTFVESKHSRIIVIDGDIENIIGYVHHQQLLDNPEKITDIVLEIPFFPDTMNAQLLMMQFLKEGKNIAVVVDEYGSIDGLITLEDFLEEIFGEIEDEHDQEDQIEERISSNEFLFSGRIEIDYLNDKYEEIDIPEGEYHTLSGYIINTEENIPEKGDVIKIDNYEFLIREVTKTKIETVKMSVKTANSQ